MAFAGASWVLFAYFGGNVHQENLSEFLIKGDFVLGIVMVWAFWYFGLNYYLDVIRRQLTSKQKTTSAITLAFTAISALLTLTPLFVRYSRINGDVVSQSTTLYDLFYALPATLFLVFGILYLSRARRLALGSERVRTNLIFISLFGTLIIIGVPFLIISAIAGGDFFVSHLQHSSILGLFIFVAGTAYAMIKHHLFDIKLAIVRSITYVLSLATMAAMYVILILSASDLFFDSEEISSAQQAVFVVVALFMALTWQSLKKFFDKLTDKIFYREKYDAEKLLSDYTDFLVDEIDTSKIVKTTIKLIDDTVSPETSLVVLYKEGFGLWYGASGQIYGDERDELAKALEYQSMPIYVTDAATTREEPFIINIKNHMENSDFGVSVRLSTHGQLEGFILLGDKKSGSSYTPKDLNFLVTIAGELSVSLQNSQRFDQIQRFNITLQREVNEATARLKQTNEKLKALDTAKDEFISMASHQLRTPLTAAKGYLSMVLEGDVGKLNKDQTNMLQEAFASSQRMVYLIADLLNVSRLKTGKFIISPSKISLADIVEQEVEQLIPTAQSRHLKLSFDKPKRFPKVMLDQTKTRQVIMNFIDNAIYYTKPGGTIDVRLTAKKDSLEYAVKDTGIGVPKTDQPKLFTKFFRAGNARKARPDGTGLGLYMAQRVISAQGGNIIFDSVEGKGSTFGFSFPRNKIEVKKPTRKKSTKR